MRETGTVIAIDNGTATIEMAAAAHSGCGSCGLCRAGADGKTMTIEVSVTEGLAVGDGVTIEIPGPDPGMSAVIVFLLPLVCFMAGLGVGAWLLPGRHALAVGIGLAAMAASLFCVAGYDRRLRRSPRHQPRIVEDNSSQHRV